MFYKLITLCFFFLIPLNMGYSGCHWAELPEGTCQEFIFSDSPKCILLDQLLESYHREPKDCPIAAGIRIAKLVNIRDFLKGWMEEEPHNVNLHYLHTHVESKYNYLRAIMRLYLRGKMNEEHLKEYHEPQLADSTFKPLFLSNDIFYSSKDGQYQGAHWIESIDPCHRVIGDYYKRWLSLRSTKKACPWFFLWLETQNVPLNIPAITYLKSWEVEDCRMTTKDGLLCDFVTEEPLNGSYLYVVDLNNRSLIHAQEPGIYFSSFSRGKPLKAAAYIQCDDGVISSIKYDSERYVPRTNDHYIQLVRHFSAQFIPMMPSVMIEYTTDRIKYEIAIQSKIMDDGDTFINELLYRARVGA